MVGIRQKEKNNERNECINERSTTKKLTDESEHGHGQFLMRVLKGGGGYQSHFTAHFFRNPTSQCSNPIPTSRMWKKS